MSYRRTFSEQSLELRNPLIADVPKITISTFLNYLISRKFRFHKLLAQKDLLTGRCGKVFRELIFYYHIREAVCQ